MSRGPGRMQRALFAEIRARGKPMTFAEMRGGDKPDPDVERAARRALERLVQVGRLIRLGHGGPGDPFRYFIHPSLISTMGDPELQKALVRHLETYRGTSIRV
jgi:hypothetical protein